MNDRLSEPNIGETIWSDNACQIISGVIVYRLANFLINWIHMLINRDFTLIIDHLIGR